MASPPQARGNIEVPGAADIYSFDGVVGQSLIFDTLVGSTGQFRVILRAPDGTQLFNSFYVDQHVVLPQAGTYTLTMSGFQSPNIGVYSFRLLLVPAPQAFAITIGDTVSDGVPAVGAGNLEAPGAVDVYSFEGVVGQGIIFDALVGSAGQFRVILTAPDGTQLLNGFYVDQPVVLSQSGTYTLTISGLQIPNTGVYSFHLLLVFAPEVFAISIGDTVSDGVPAVGAGNLESPGAIDIYTFDVVAGQQVIFDTLVGSTGQFFWSLEAPDGTIVFDAFYVDQNIVLVQTGTYRLTVRGSGADEFGTYSFRLLLPPVPADIYH